MAQYHQDNKHLDWIVSGGPLYGGALVQVAGKAGILGAKADSSEYADGELAAVTIRGVVRVANADGLVFADGATVGYDAAGDKAVAAAGGDFDCGTCVGGAAAGDAWVHVLLNG